MRYTVEVQQIEPYRSAVFTYPFSILGEAIDKYSKYKPALFGKIKVSLKYGTREVQRKFIENWASPPVFKPTIYSNNTEKIT